MTISSNYHTEVDPSNAGIHDRIVVMELIKATAQTHHIDISQKEFKGLKNSIKMFFYYDMLRVNIIVYNYIIKIKILLYED